MNLNRLKLIYSKVDAHWTYDCMPFALAGVIYGAVDRFDYWSHFMHRWNVWDLTRRPITVIPFRWEWTGLSMKLLISVPILVLLERQIRAAKASKDTWAALFIHIGVAVVAALLVKITASSCDGLAFGLAGGASIAVAAETFKRTVAEHPNQADQ